MEKWIAQHFAGPGLATGDDCDDGEEVFWYCFTNGSKQEREGWILLKIPRGDIDGVGGVK